MASRKELLNRRRVIEEEEEENDANDPSRRLRLEEWLFSFLFSLNNISSYINQAKIQVNEMHVQFQFNFFSLS